MKLKIIKTIDNIKFPKIINYNNNYYIFGIVSQNVEKNINKFILICNKYNNNLELITRIKINYNFDSSALIWNIEEDENNFIFLIEYKSVDILKHTNNYFKYFIKKENIEKFQVEKIEKYELNNHLISKEYNNFILSSKIEIDEERPNYYWGKYLFLFYKDKIPYKPNFDKIVDYSKDKGHLLHYIEKLHEEYIIFFTIRHKYQNKNEYYYKIYTSMSKDLINFYNTEELKINNNITISKWYCYPEIFIKNNEYYILLNQDDFGKNKNTLLGKVKFI